MSLLTVLVMLFRTTVAHAEKYTLHSGIEAGMTVDKVIAKQKERGNIFESDNHRLKNTTISNIWALHINLMIR